MMNFENLFRVRTLLVVFAVVLASVAILKLILFVICWHLKRKYFIKINLSNVSFTSLKGISVRFPNGFNLEIDIITLTSCLFNSKHKALLGVNINGVTVSGSLLQTSQPPEKEITSHPIEQRIYDQLQRFILQLSSLSRLRLVSLYIQNVQVTQFGFRSEKFPDGYLSTLSLQDIAVSVSKPKSTSLDVKVAATGIYLKVNKDGNEVNTVAELSCSVFIKLLKSESQLLEISTAVDQLQVIVFDLPSSLVQHSHAQKPGNEELNVARAFNCIKELPITRVILHFANTRIRVEDSFSSQAFDTMINRAEINFSKNSVTDVECKLSFQEVSSSKNELPLLNLTRLIWITKLEEETTINPCFNVFFVSEISSCCFLYEESDLICLMQLFNSRSRGSSERSGPSSLVEKALNQNLPYVKLAWSADLNNICCRNQKRNVTYALSHSKISAMVQPDPLLKELSCEFLIDSLTCKTQQSQAEVMDIKKLLCRLYYSAISDVKICCSSDGVQVDFDHLVQTINTFRNTDERTADDEKQPTKKRSFSVTQITINVKNTAIVTENIKISVASGNIDSDSGKFATFVNDFQVNSLYSMLHKSQEPTHKIMQLKQAKWIFNRDSNERSICFQEEIYFQWNVQFHLSAVNFFKKIKQFTAARNGEEDSSKKPSVKTLMKFDGDINIGALLSNSGQLVEFCGKTLAISLHCNGKSYTSDCVTVYFDHHKIARFEQVNFAVYPENESCKVSSRKDYVEELQMKRNRLLLISMESVKIVFPYQYNFAMTFNEKFLSIIKWVRQFHRSGKKSTDEVATDIYFKVQSAIVEVNDDPFEVKLRDNYELLEDEYRESVKRNEMLNERLIQYQKRNIMIGPSKLNELHAALAGKQAEIYIKRQKQLYDSVPVRTRLFAMQIESVKIKLFADSSLTGYDQLVKIMRSRLDRESPFPDEMRFSSIWCRLLHATCNVLCCRLRDFHKPLFDVKAMDLKGLLMGAEQEATSRALRTVLIDTTPSTPPIALQRSMTTLKLYHDLNMKVNTIAYTHGACWEPVLQQLNLSFENIIKPSSDPSPPLTWWDKMRFLFHGPLLVSSNSLSLFFHSSLNPYNSAELIEICFTKSLVEWLTGKINVIGNLDLLMHTASKYDECRIVHLPNIKMSIQLSWLCVSNQNDHHSVIPCAADKIPDYSSHHIHDSYRAFRSQNLNLAISIESDPKTFERLSDIPLVLLYGSTFRWFENQKTYFAGIARLTRRGKLFKNTKPRKMPFSRIFKDIRVTVCLHKLKVSYWSSVSRQYGCELIGHNLTHSAVHNLSLIAFDDGLTRRPRPLWEMAFMNSEIRDVELWLYNKKNASTLLDEELENARMYFLSFSRMSYNREASQSCSTNTVKEIPGLSSSPRHRLILTDLRGAWTKDNRTVVIALFDMYMKVEQLKRNLSTDALKGFKIDGQNPFCGSSPVKGKYQKQHSKTSPASTMNKGNAVSMLQKLIAECEMSSSNVVCTEDIESEIGHEEPKLWGAIACSGDDVIYKNWLIEFVNSQVMLRGSETAGYVIVSSAKTEVWQNVHRPVWKERTLYSKTTWVGSIEFMQYYATVDAGGTAGDNYNMVWLNVDNIEEKSSMSVSDLPDLVGSGHSAGGVVSSEVGISSRNDPSSSPVQLQRIISRCGCKFYYVHYTEDVDRDIFDEVPPLPEDDDLLILEPWEKDVAVDSFTLTHNDLDICTNSQQFAMIMDLVNNLLLYVEPHKKEAYERLQTMRFRLLLSSSEDQREPILQFQDNLRLLVHRLKELERESYIIKKTIAEDQSFHETSNMELLEERNKIESQIERCKENLNRMSDELAVMISCFKEAQLSADRNRERQAAAQDGGAGFVASVVRRIEICFKHATWRLTDQDGQLGLCDMMLSNFLYTKVAKNDDSVEHTLELGYIMVTNLMPSQAYQTVLMPTALKPNIPLDRQHALRIFCRERAPVGGISVKEHFEINVIPITIEITNAFYNTMLRFFFPERYESSSGADSNVHSHNKARKRNKLQKDDSVSSDSTTSTQLAIPNIKAFKEDDIEKMRERALKNQTFVYIKIPEVPIRVSYKGTKEKNISDINNFSLILPTIEYHNQTWTWLDLFMAIKNESKHRLLSQAVKQKLQIKPNFLGALRSSDENSSKDFGPVQSNQEEEEQKARLLLGNIAVPNSTSNTKSSKRLSLFAHRK